MNRIEFMEQLKELLYDISESERNEAIQYYNDYFDDAGSENEGIIIGQLNSPQKVAEIIKAGLNEEEIVTGEFSERGFKDIRFEDKQEVMKECVINEPNNKKEGKKNETGKIILIVLLCLLAIPVGLPLVTGIAGTIIGLFGAIVGILIAIFSTTLALILAGIVVLGIGIAKIFLVPATGFVICGAGLIILAIGILFLLLSIWIVTKGIPFCVKGIIGLFHKIFSKQGGKVV